MHTKSFWDPPFPPLISPMEGLALCDLIGLCLFVCTGIMTELHCGFCIIVWWAYIMSYNISVVFTALVIIQANQSHVFREQFLIKEQIHLLWQQLVWIYTTTVLDYARWVYFLFLAPKHSKEFIGGIVQKHYCAIHEVVTINPALFARKLYSRQYIERSTFKVATGVSSGMTNDTKADELVQACQTFITTHEDPKLMLQILLEILEEGDPAGSNVAKLVRKVSDYIAILQCFHYSAFTVFLTIHVTNR